MFAQFKKRCCTVVALTLPLLCTEIKAQSAEGPPKIQAGLTYLLNKSVLTVRVTRQLIECNGLGFKVQQTAEISGETGTEDSDRRYMVSTDNLEKFFKSNSITITQSNVGTLTAIQNTSTDKTGEFIVSVLGSAVKIAASAAGLPKGIIPAAVPNQLCNAATLGLLGKLSAAKKIIEELPVEIANKKKRLADMVEQAGKGKRALEKKIADIELLLDQAKAKAKEKQDDQVLAAHVTALEIQIKKAKSKETERAANATAEQKELTNEISENEALLAQLPTQITKLETALTKQDTYRFSPSPGRALLRLDPSEDTIFAWFSETGLNVYRNNNGEHVCRTAFDEQRPCDTTREIIPRATVTYIGTIAPQAASPNDKYPPNDADPGGIIYRQPLSAEVVVCARAACSDSLGKAVTAGAGSIILMERRVFPQFGIVGILPYASSHIFQTLTVDLQFYDNGAVKKLTYTTNALADKTAETFSKSVDELVKLKDIRIKKESEEAALKTKDIEADTKLKEAMEKNIQADIKLKAAQAAQK